jgi:hypothetical protein
LGYTCDATTVTVTNDDLLQNLLSIIKCFQSILLLHTSHLDQLLPNLPIEDFFIGYGFDLAWNLDHHSLNDAAVKF